MAGHLAQLALPARARHAGGDHAHPIRFDDFPLYKSGVSFEAWEREALKIIRENEFTAFGLHDCYAQYWLPRFGEFLAKVQDLGRVETVGKVADRVALGCAE